LSGIKRQGPFGASSFVSPGFAGQILGSGIGTSPGLTGTSYSSRSNVGTSSFSTGFSGPSYSTPSLNSFSVPEVSNFSTSLNVGTGFNSFALTSGQQLASAVRAHESRQLQASHNQMVNAELSGIAQYHQSVASTRKFDQLTAPVANFVADLTPYLGAAKSA
jgi:hypothetical protein